MQKIELDGLWHIRSHDGIFSLEGTVPGSFFHELEKSGYWGEQGLFYRENNHACTEIANRDFTYERTFDIPQSFLGSNRRCFLEAGGLDTLAEINLNGSRIAAVENMFRRYSFAVDSVITPGENTIAIVFRNAIQEIEKRQARRPLWNPDHTLDGAVHLRKSHCSFGWDWGPCVPDLGIWRPIRLASYEGARLIDFRVIQKHTDGQVRLEFEVQHEQWDSSPVAIVVAIEAPAGDRQEIRLDENGRGAVDIRDPQLWWPNGYGDQPLYRLECELRQYDRAIDARALKIGLRQLHLERQQDAFGESFQFNINGMAIFARGANYVPEDIFLTRPTVDSTERLIRAAAEANFNCLRVWGGGIYPSDAFFDLCDRYGLIVWQDLMFACGVYDIHNETFYENIREEVRDNLRRIRHHACLGLICGNNEMEWAFETWPFPKTKEMRTEYLKQYQILFPELAAAVCPEIDYWPASPSSGGHFDEPNAEDRGDVHYWEVWHGNKPFTEYRNHTFRFLSEFGFESFPSIKTVRAFTDEEDRNIFSPVMEDHQRCAGGNGKILNYLSQYFRFPKDFESLIYVSQLSQAEAIRFAVEHLRRNRGRCMGTTYWQLNDVWPGASWSSIDYFGRWKALHYFARRFFDQVLISCAEQNGTAGIHVSNEHNHRVGGKVSWRLATLSGESLDEGHKHIIVEPFDSREVVVLDYASILHAPHDRDYVLSFTLDEKHTRRVYRGLTSFVPYKYLNLTDPGLEVQVEEDERDFKIEFAAKQLAKFVELDLQEGDLIFSDNYFDLEAGQSCTIWAAKGEMSIDHLRRHLTVRSLYDSYR